MDELVDIQPVKESRMSKLAGPAFFVGCFVIWPVATLGASYIGLRQAQTALETAKVIATFKS